MALLTIGTFDVPPPLVDSYEVTTEPETTEHKNVLGVTLGEFRRWRRRIRWSYRDLTASNNTAICAAMKINTPGTNLMAVAVTYWDNDTSTFKTGNFIGQKTSPKFHNFAPTARYTDVNFELVEQ